MQFFNNIKSSIYNPNFYNEILNKPFSYSLKYFLSLAVLIAIVTTIVFSFSTLPKINKFIGEIDVNVLKYYPDELVITAKNGIISTNVPEPYFIKMPAELKDENIKPAKNESEITRQDMAELENLVVIDTKSPLTVDLFLSYKTFALVGRDSIAFYDNSAVKIQPTGPELNGVLTKAKVLESLDKIMPYIKIIPVALIPIAFIFSFIGFIFGNLIYLIFGAFVIWLAAKIMKRELEYGKAYQIGFHAITLGVILEAIIFQFYPILNFPFLFTILMVMIVWINLKFSSPSDNIPPAPKVKNF